MRPLSLILILLVFSCSSPVMKQLEEIDSHLADKPEEALSLLEEMKDNPAIKSGKDRRSIAKHSLLYVIAMDKCYIDTAGLSVIQPAVDYYARHGNTSDRKRMHYYYGRVLEHAKDYQNAILTFEKALSLSETDDYYFNGLTYSAIGRMYQLSHNNKEALEYTKMAHDSFVDSGHKENTRATNYSLGLIMHNLRDFEAADSLLREVIGGLDSLQYRKYAAAQFARNLMYCQPPRLGETIEVYERMQNLRIPLDAEDKACFAYALLLEGEKTRAEQLLSELGRIPADHKAQVWRRSAAIHEGDYELAHILIEKIRSYEDEYIKEKLEQSLFKAQSENSILIAESADQERRFAIMSAIIVSLLFILLSVVIGIIAAMKRRESENEIKRLISAAEESTRMLTDMENELKKTKDHQEEALSQLRKAYVSLFRKQFEQISKAFDPNNLVNSRDIHERLYKTVDDLLVSLSEPSSQKALEEMVDSHISGIITSIRKDFPKLTDDDIRFLCYLIMGFDNTSISVLMNISRENVRVKRHRLRNRIMSYENGKYQDFSLCFSC